MLFSKSQISSVGSEPKLGSAQLGFGSSFWAKKLGLAHHAFQKARLGLAPHILQKKLGSAWLALSFKKPSYLEKQKNELISNIFANSLIYNPEDIKKSAFFLLKI